MDKRRRGDVLTAKQARNVLEVIQEIHQHAANVGLKDKEKGWGGPLARFFEIINEYVRARAFDSDSKPAEALKNSEGHLGMLGRRAYGSNMPTKAS